MEKMQQMMGIIYCCIAQLTVVAIVGGTIVRILVAGNFECVSASYCRQPRRTVNVAGISKVVTQVPIVESIRTTDPVVTIIGANFIWLLLL